MQFSQLSKLVVICGIFSVAFVPQGTNGCENTYENESEPPSPALTFSTRFPGVGAEYVRNLRNKHDGEIISVEDKLAMFQKSGDFKHESDYATALMRTGEARQARDIFVRLANEHPEEYIIAANLGTAYELTGDNEQALSWIRRGMKLNPQSHGGTEWLHVKILQAKIAAEKDPEWLKKHGVLTLDFGSATRPGTPGELERDDAGQPLTLNMIRHALEYQLHERLFYVKPQDYAVAHLLEALGNLLALDGETDKAFHVLQLAVEYSPEPTDLLTKRLSAFNPFNQVTNPVSAVPAPAESPLPIRRLALLSAVALGMAGMISAVWIYRTVRAGT